MAKQKVQVEVKYTFWVESEEGLTQADVDANEIRHDNIASHSGFTELYDVAETIIEDAFWPRKDGQFIAEFEWSHEIKLVDQDSSPIVAVVINE